MTGAWARACDAHGVARDDDDHAELAVASLGQAMVCRPSETIDQVEYAGAHIRAWRKSLPAQSERWSDVTGEPTDRLLWVVLGYVNRAQYYTTSGKPSLAAYFLRQAEAMMRTWWKRTREEQP